MLLSMPSGLSSHREKPLFLDRKYIDPESSPISQRKSTASEKNEAIRSLIYEVWPGLSQHQFRALQNLFVQLASFHRSYRLSAKRISTSVSILIEVLLTLSGYGLPSPEFVFARFKQMLMRHSIKRTPFSIAIFSLIEVKLLTQFFLDNVLRYCHFYQHLLGKTCHLELYLNRGIAPRLPVVPPLAKANIVKPSIDIQSSQNSDSDALTEDEIQLILTDPVAKARFESLVQPKLADLQSKLDAELARLDMLYAGNQTKQTA